MILTIPHANPLRGEVSIPGDKSISHRALLFSALAEGTSIIRGLSRAGDPRSTRRCLQDLGIACRDDGDACIVAGRGIRGFRASNRPLDAGNSGTTMRLLTGVLCGQNFGSVVTGDDSLRQRPMNRIITPLASMGARVHGTETGRAPLTIEPSDSLHAIQYTMPVASAQVKSAILLAGLYADGVTSVIEPIATRDHTERMLGLAVDQSNGTTRVSITGGMRVEPREFEVPGDPSGAAFLVGAATVVPGSELRICSVSLNPGRIAFLRHLKSLGASVTIENKRTASGEPVGDLVVRNSVLAGSLSIGAEDVPDVIDEIPLLAVTALISGCAGSVRGANELRAKESDRIRALVLNMRALGAEVEEYPDGFAFESKNRLIGTEIESFEDHRIAMAFGVAGLIVRNVSIRGAESAAISFPTFWKTIGAAPQP